MPEANEKKIVDMLQDNLYDDVAVHLCNQHYTTFQDLLDAAQKVEVRALRKMQQPRPYANAVKSAPERKQSARQRLLRRNSLLRRRCTLSKIGWRKTKEVFLLGSKRRMFLLGSCRIVQRRATLKNKVDLLEIILLGRKLPLVIIVRSQGISLTNAANGSIIMIG